MSLRDISHFTKSVRIKINNKLDRKAACSACSLVRGYLNCLPKNDSRKGGFPNNKGLTDEAFKKGFFLRFTDNDERDKFINCMKKLGNYTVLENLGIKKTKPKKQTTNRFKVVSG